MASNFIPLASGTQALGSAADFASEFFDAVSSERFFDDFSRAECAELCAHLHCYGVPTNALILKESESGDFMLILLTGAVAIIKSLGRDDETTLAILGPGALVGELSLLDGDRRYASCVARAPSDFAVLTRDALNDILVDHPRLGNKVLLMLLRAHTAHWRDSASQVLVSTMGPLV